MNNLITLLSLFAAANFFGVAAPAPVAPARAQVEAPALVSAATFAEGDDDKDDDKGDDDDDDEDFRAVG
jgi:hypothetical protein